MEINNNHPENDLLNAIALDECVDNKSDLMEHIKECSQCNTSVNDLRSIKNILSDSTLVELDLVTEDHLDDETIISYVNNRNNEVYPIHVQNHLNECGQCMVAVLEYRAHWAERQLQEQQRRTDQKESLYLVLKRFFTGSLGKRIVIWSTVPLVAASVILGMSIQFFLDMDTIHQQELEIGIAETKLHWAETHTSVNDSVDRGTTFVGPEFKENTEKIKLTGLESRLVNIDVKKNTSKSDIVLKENKKSNTMALANSTKAKIIIPVPYEKNIIHRKLENISDKSTKHMNVVDADSVNITNNERTDHVAENIYIQDGGVESDLVENENTIDEPLFNEEIMASVGIKIPSLSDEYKSHFEPTPDIDRTIVKKIPFNTWESKDKTRVYRVDSTQNTLVITEKIATNVYAESIIETGKGASGVIGNKDDTHVFVTNKIDGTLSVVDVNSHKVEKNIYLGSNPYCFTFSSDESRLYVVNRYGDRVNIVDPVKLILTGTSRINELDIEVRYNNCYYGCHQDKRRNMQRVASKMLTGKGNEMFNAEYLQERGENPQLIMDFLKIRELSEGKI